MTTKLLSEFSVKPSRYHPHGSATLLSGSTTPLGAPPYFEFNPRNGPSIPAQQDAETNLIGRQKLVVNLSVYKESTAPPELVQSAANVLHLRLWQEQGVQ